MSKLLHHEEVNSETAGYQLGSQTKLLPVSVAEWLKCQVCKTGVIGSNPDQHFVLCSF